MRNIALALLLAGCSGTNGDLIPIDSSEPDAFIDTFDNELLEFRTAICAAASMCEGEDLTTCEMDVTNDMAEAKAQLDDTGEMACARCMHRKTIEARAFVGFECSPTSMNRPAIIAACDITPMNGMDSDDEACAGFP